MNILYMCNYYHRAMIFRDAMNALENKNHVMLAFNSTHIGDKIDKKYHAIMDEKVVHRECYRYRDRYFYFWKQFKIYKALVESVDLKNIDLIHCHTVLNGGWVARKIKRKYGIPYIVSVRNTDINVYLKIPVFVLIARMIVRESKGVMFLSEAYKEKFLNMCYSKRKREEIKNKSTVIVNGLEEFWLKNRGVPKEKCHEPLRLICVGKIDRNKNMKTVVDVVRKLNLMGLPTMLTIIGQVVDEDILGELETERNVTLVPFLTKEELISYYRNSDIYIMPSIHESFGRVYAEAMSQGLPVIYTRGQGFDGLFEEGVVGYSVQATNVDEIIEAVQRIIKRYSSISNNCIEKSRIFDWIEISEQLEKMYM